MKAFPTSESLQYKEHIVGGMDLRDYFAAKAMQGMLSNSAFDTIEEMMRTSIVAYMMADAMMKTREESE